MVVEFNDTCGYPKVSLNVRNLHGVSNGQKKERKKKKLTEVLNRMGIFLQGLNLFAAQF
jgi:hypothetical protein